MQKDNNYREHILLHPGKIPDQNVMTAHDSMMSGLLTLKKKIQLTHSDRTSSIIYQNEEINHHV